MFISVIQTLGSYVWFTILAKDNFETRMKLTFGQLGFKIVALFPSARAFLREKEAKRIEVYYSDFRKIYRPGLQCTQHYKNLR